MHWKKPGPLPLRCPLGKISCSLHKTHATSAVHDIHSWYCERSCFLSNSLVMNLLHRALVCEHRQLPLCTKESKLSHLRNYLICQVEICTVNKSILGREKTERTTRAMPDVYNLEEQIIIKHFGSITNLSDQHICFQVMQSTNHESHLPPSGRTISARRGPIIWQTAHLLFPPSSYQWLSLMSEGKCFPDEI